MKVPNPYEYAVKVTERTLLEMFGPNVSSEIEDITKTVCNDVCKYFAYLHSFVPSVEQPYPLSDTDFFKQQNKDAE